MSSAKNCSKHIVSNNAFHQPEMLAPHGLGKARSEIMFEMSGMQNEVFMLPELSSL